MFNRPYSFAYAKLTKIPDIGPLRARLIHPRGLPDCVKKRNFAPPMPKLRLAST